MKVGRPRINPYIRFSDVIPIWEFAEPRGGANYICASERKATATMHRLNQARQALRDADGLGMHSWDRFVVRKEGRKIMIRPKQPLDLSMFVDDAGWPIPTQEVEKVIGGKEEGLPDFEVQK